MKTPFQLIPFKKEIDFKISGSLERNSNLFTLILNFMDPHDSIKFSNSQRASSIRAFGLWEKTCFEVFLKKPNSCEYVELNFSADLEWNCFHFDNYKEGMKDQKEVNIISQNFEPKAKIFTACWNLDRFEGPLNCGLSSIIETKGKTKSYWALKHPNLTPDFHDFKSFTLTLWP